MNNTLMLMRPSTLPTDHLIMVIRLLFTMRRPIRLIIIPQMNWICARLAVVIDLVRRYAPVLPRGKLEIIVSRMKTPRSMLHTRYNSN